MLCVEYPLSAQLKHKHTAGAFEKEIVLVNLRRIMLPPNMSGGPHNLGDPDDQTLRKVEREILIPMKMRDKTKQEKCVLEGQAFTECCKASKFWMVWKCKKETNVLTECLNRWYNDDEFKQLCTEEYLNERAEYRRTGIKQKQKKKESAMF